MNAAELEQQLVEKYGRGVWFTMEGDEGRVPACVTLLYQRRIERRRIARDDPRRSKLHSVPQFEYLLP